MREKDARNLLVVSMILLVAAVVASGCTPLKLVGTPESTGLIVFEAEVRKEGLLGLRTYKAKTGVMSGEPNNPDGGAFRGYVLFSGVVPGNYTLTQFSFNEPISQKKFRRITVSLSPKISDEFERLRVDVAAGQIIYVGKLIVIPQDADSFLDNLTWQQELQFLWEYTVADEIDAFSALANAYKATVWGSRINSELERLEKAQPE